MLPSDIRERGDTPRLGKREYVEANHLLLCRNPWSPVNRGFMANPLLWLLNHSGTVLDAQLKDDSLLQALMSKWDPKFSC